MDENNTSKIITIEEKSSCCNGSGNDSDIDYLRGELVAIVWWMENKFTQQDRDKTRTIGDIVDFYLKSEHYHPSNPPF